MAGANQIVVAYCHADKVDAFFHDCFTQLVFRDRETTRRIAHVSSYQTGPTLSLARQVLAKDFLKNRKPTPWLLFLDTDMAFGPGLLEALLTVAHPIKAPVVGGLCFTCDRHGGQVAPTMYGSDWQPVRDYPRDQLVEVTGTGAACLFIHRSVLVALDDDADPLCFFGEEVIDGRPSSEDRAFCARVRRAGFPIHVHTGIPLGHVKPRIVAEEEYLASLTPSAT